MAFKLCFSDFKLRVCRHKETITNIYSYLFTYMNSGTNTKLIRKYGVVILIKNNNIVILRFTD